VCCAIFQWHKAKIEAFCVYIIMEGWVFRVISYPQWCRWSSCVEHWFTWTTWHNSQPKTILLKYLNFFKIFKFLIHKCGFSINPGPSQLNITGYVHHSLWKYESVFLCRCDILMAATVKIAVIFNMMQHSVVDIHWHLRQTLCLQPQDTSLKMEAGLPPKLQCTCSSLNIVTSQKTVMIRGLLLMLNMKEPTASPRPCPIPFHCHFLCSLAWHFILLD
jgi:hypothetical protein